MKKIISFVLSVFIALIMSVSVLSVGFSAMAATSVSAVNISSETELFEKISNGYKGATQRLKGGEVGTFTFTTNKTSYVFVNASSKNLNNNSVTFTLGLYSVNQSVNFENNYAYGVPATCGIVYKLPKGTYVVTTKSGSFSSDEYDTTVYVGLLPESTKFINVKYLGSVSNNGQTFKLQFNFLDTPIAFVFDNSNGKRGYDYSTIKNVGGEKELDSNGCGTFSMEDYSDCWFHFGYKDIYGITHSCEYQIMNPFSTYSTSSYSKGSLISGISNKYYTGKAVKQSGISVKAGYEGASFTETYKNNVNVGTATVTLVGKGETLGCVSKTFKISLKPTAISKLLSKKKAVTVKYAKGQANAGYQVQYSLKKNMKKAKTITVKGAKTTNKTIKKLKKGKKYYVRVRTYATVNGKKAYSSWSAKKSVKVK